MLLLVNSTFAAGDNPNETNLPPPVDFKIDFARDIKPIFEDSCYQCHSATKPRSHFRLDNRESALAGGDDGVDIRPGRSDKSALIYYVAGLDSDIQMPPPGKAPALTTNEIALLRAWIDQGVSWEAAAPTSTAWLSPFLGYTAVNGDKNKFRELNWQPGGLDGGLEHFELWEQTGTDSTLSLSGRLRRDDYKLELDQEKTDFGYVRAGWQQFRKYYDTTGGYDPLISPSVSSLNAAPYFDDGHAWIDFGLTLPDWPTIVLGYEYQYRRGDEATLSWGNLSPLGRNVNPTSENLQEGTHVIKLDVSDDIGGTHIEDNVRGEFYSLARNGTNEFYSDTLQTPESEFSAEGYHYFQGANTVRVERKFNDWLFTSAGYLYSKLDASASTDGNMNDVTGQSLNNNWQSQSITLSRQSDVGNLNALLGPWDGLTFSGGVQGEWTREQGFGNDNLINTFQGAIFSQTNVTQITSLNTEFLEETASARYTRIPFTSLFAEASLRQERDGENEYQPNDAGVFFDPALALDSHWNSQMHDWRAGFNTSPWNWASFSAHYRRYDDDTHYDVFQNDQPPGTTNVGYPGFIHARDLLTDEIEARLVLRPTGWLKTTFSYKLQDTDYRTETYPADFGPGFIISPGGAVPAGVSTANIYSVNATITPWQRLYLSTTFSFQRSSTVTANNGSTAVEPYRGDTYSLLNTATWTISPKSDVLLTYLFSKADFSQDNFASGLPLGIRFQQHSLQAGLTRRFSRNIITKLQYAFYYYDEPTAGGADNYRANSILAMLSLKMP